MYFFIKTANPRPTFHADMTTEERTIMEKHVAFWSEKASQGKAIVFGPVMDPAGVYGIAVSQVQDEAEMREILESDPAKGLLHYDVVLPMACAVVGTLHG